MDQLADSHSKAQLDRLVMISLRRQYIYCPISKVANSSIKAFLFEAELRELGMSQFINNLSTSSVHDVLYGPLIFPMQLKANHFDRIVSNGNFFKFVMVRNPIDRIISCYLDRVLLPMSAVHKSVCTSLGREPGSEISFADFVELVSTQTPKEMNPHWRMQFFECGYDTIKYDKVYKYEKFSESVSDFLQKLYPNTASKIDINANYSPAVTKAKSRRAEILTPEIEGKIRNIYKLDFETFSY